jgi:hypothetical protein
VAEGGEEEGVGVFAMTQGPTEPMGEGFDMAEWWAKLDSYGDEPFMPQGREQPPMPTDDRQYFER